LTLAHGGGLGHARAAMAQVDVTQHLTTLFPQLRCKPLSVEAATLAELVAALELLAPGVAFYICDERGRLRRHVNIFVDNEMLIDRKALGDRLTVSSRVFIAQALSGG
jgi:molybdopterin synthase sulfur carrier subunit